MSSFITSTTATMINHSRSRFVLINEQREKELRKEVNNLMIKKKENERVKWMNVQYKKENRVRGNRDDNQENYFSKRKQRWQ